MCIRCTCLKHILYPSQIIDILNISHELRNIINFLRKKLCMILQYPLLRKTPFTSVEKWVLPQFHMRDNEGRHEKLLLFSLIIDPRGEIVLVTRLILNNNIFVFWKLERMCHYSSRFLLISEVENVYLGLN